MGIAIRLFGGLSILALGFLFRRVVDRREFLRLDAVVEFVTVNSLTHLLTEEDLLLALQQFYECTRPGGGCLLTIRDYDQEERGVGIVKPYGVREENGKRYLIFQVWDFVDQTYDLTMYFVEDDRASEQLVTHAMRTRYNAVGTDDLLSLMREAGFSSTERIDGRFYQPVLVGTREG